MHLLFFVSMAPSLQEVTPLPRARGFTPLMRPIIAEPLQLSIRPWAGPYLILSRSPISGFYPPVCPRRHLFGRYAPALSL